MKNILKNIKKYLLIVQLFVSTNKNEILLLISAPIKIPLLPKVF